MNTIEAYTLLRAALEKPLGVVISTDNVPLLKRRLYQARAQAKADGIFDFEQLSLFVSPTNPHTELWIIKKESTSG